MVNLLITVNNHTTKGYRTDNGEETRMNQDNTRPTKHKHVGVFLKWGYQKLDGLWWTVLVCPGWCKGVPLYMEHSTNIVMFLLTSFHRCSTNLRRYCQESMRWTSVKELCRDIHETSDGQLKDDEDNEYFFFLCVCVKKCKLHENVINHDFLGHTIFRQAQIESYRSIQGCWGKLGNGKLWQIHQLGVFGSFQGLLANCLRMIELLLAQGLFRWAIIPPPTIPLGLIGETGTTTWPDEPGSAGLSIEFVRNSRKWLLFSILGVRVGIWHVERTVEFSMFYFSAP